MVFADAVVYHPTVTHFLKYIATTVGRDKFLRTIQYFSRFYAWYLYRTNNPQSAIAPWEAMKKQFGTTRKIMRLGKFVEHIKAAAVAADAKGMDPILKYCAVGRQLGYTAYITLDNISAIDAIGIRKFDNIKKIQKEAYRMWMTGLLFNTLAGLYKLYQIKAHSSTVNKQDAEGAVQAKKLEREQNATSLQLVQDLCDLAAPSTALGFANFDDGFIGLAGTVSSLLGVYSTWKKTA
ncbi:putative peroxisomal membrane protein PMP27 [Tothia fuscella]|uniref:Peroxisomal membrane protein PMP27 n=1 Tax=Tothia fuscella TaxID=1048955 RepID=A0A9P4NEG9_9PEZI|nr:putative peroxisomal membrane protein PMP27 [Tothia fuscella]